MSKLGRQEGALGISKTRSSPTRITPIPLEWLDPDCWRLPSGKALAEFALQAGFLAPLMLGLPKPGRRVMPVTPAGNRAAGNSKAAPVDGGQNRSKGIRK